MTTTEIIELALQTYQISDKKDISFRFKIKTFESGSFVLPDMSYIYNITSVLGFETSSISILDKENKTLLIHSLESVTFDDGRGCSIQPLYPLLPKSCQFQDIGFGKTILLTDSFCTILYIEFHKIR